MVRVVEVVQKLFTWSEALLRIGTPGKRVSTRLILLHLLILFGCAIPGVPPHQPQGPLPQPEHHPPTLTFTAQNSGLQPTFQVTALATDPRNPNHLVAALYHPIGLLESWDQGRHWQPIPLRMAQDPGDPTPLPTIGETLPLPLHTLRFAEERLLLGGPLGLHEVSLPPARPTGGLVVQPSTGWPAGLAVFQLYQGAAGVRFAAGETFYEDRPRLRQQQDNESWQPLSPLPEPAQQGSAILSVLQIGVLQNRDRLLVGTDGAGLFSSDDGGREWQWNETIGETFVAALWAAPWDEELLLARTRRGLFRSTDGGAAWAGVNLPTDVRVDTIHALGDTTILLGLGDGSLLAGNDNGTQWQPWGTPLAQEGIFYSLLALPDAPTTLLAGTQNGLALALDGGTLWQQPDLRNMPATVYPVTAPAEDGGGTLYLGSSTGVYRLPPDASAWERYSDGLPAQRVLDLVAMPDPQDGSVTILFAGTDVGLYRRATNESAWHALGWAGGVPALVADPTDPNRLYLRAAFERIYRTEMALSDTPDAVSWEQRALGMATTHEILSLAVDPTNPEIAYAGGTTELFKSTDGTQSWRELETLLDGQSSFALLVDATAPTDIYAGATNGLYRSTDRGETWQPWGDALRDITVSALVQHPTEPATFFVGAKRYGLWYTTDEGITWAQAAGIPPEATVDDILVDQSGRALYAATDHGFRQAAWNPLQPAVTKTVGGQTVGGQTVVVP